MIPPTSLAPSSPRIASTSAWASRQCTTTGLRTRRARPIRWRKTRSCTSRGERLRKKSRPISPTATTRGPPARRSISVRTSASAAAASWGCTPTVAQTPGSASASAMAAREVGTSVPIVSMRVTPACRARAIISARSPSNSGKCRCAWVSKSSRLTSSSRVRGSRRDSETHTADELARRRHHVHRPSPLRIGGKADLTRERPVALAPATLDRRETDDVDDLALEPPDVVHGLLESRRRVDRGVGNEPVPEHRLGGDRRRQLERTDGDDVPSQPRLGEEQRRRRDGDATDEGGARGEHADQPRDHESARPGPRPRATEGRRQRHHRHPCGDRERRHRRQANQRQGEVQRAEERDEEEDVADQRIRVHDGLVPRVERREKRERDEGEKEEDVDRRQRGRGPVGREQEQEDAVIERLDHVLGRGQHQAVGAPLRDDQRVPYLDEDRDEEPEQEQVADDQAHVRQATAEHEEGEETAEEGRERDAPGLREGEDHPGGPRRSTMARATSSRRSACTQSSTSAAADVARRWAPTKSSALARTPPSSAQISRSTRAMDASRSATSRIVRTYSSVSIAIISPSSRGAGRGPA